MGLTSSLHACYDITPQKIESIQDVDTTRFLDIEIEY